MWWGCVVAVAEVLAASTDAVRSGAEHAMLLGLLVAAIGYGAIVVAIQPDKQIDGRHSHSRLSSKSGDGLSMTWLMVLVIGGVFILVGLLTLVVGGIALPLHGLGLPSFDPLPHSAKRGGWPAMLPCLAFGFSFLQGWSRLGYLRLAWGAGWRGRVWTILACIGFPMMAAGLWRGNIPVSAIGAALVLSGILKTQSRRPRESAES
jgi:hypothetical protein